MKTPKIFLLIGAPCSGKSYWTENKLKASDEEFVVISSDNIIEKLSADDGLNYTQGWKKYIGLATSMMKSQFSKAVADGKNIIYDQTNMGAKKRKSVLDQVPDYEKIAVIFDCDTKTLLERNINRAKTVGKSIPENVIFQMLKNYQAPTKDEFDTIMRVQT